MLSLLQTSEKNRRLVLEIAIFDGSIKLHFYINYYGLNTNNKIYKAMSNLNYLFYKLGEAREHRLILPSNYFHFNL